MYISITIVTVLLFNAILVQPQCLTNNDSRGVNNNNAHKSLYIGQQEFSLAMMKEIVRQTPASSVFFSPYSTYHALLLAYFISRNQTEKSLKSALRLPAEQDKIDVMQAYNFEKLLRTINSANQSYDFVSANRIYVSQDAGVRPCMATIFAQELKKTDFRNKPEKARLEINNWIENVTKSQIKDLLPPGVIDSTTNLVLANAAYFKGHWESQFDSEMTRKDVFHISGSEKTFVDMMVQEGTFNHEVSEVLGAHILELPYVGKDISMYIFLPPFATDTGVDNILSKLNATTFQELVKEGGMYPKTVIVSLPKFTMEQTVDLVPILRKLGAGDIFNGNADFSTLTNTEQVRFNGAKHVAKITLDEDGSEAAAATNMISYRMLDFDSVSFACRHPFVYIIYRKKRNSILFAGIYRKP